jgi:hypothetical protein
MLVESGLEKHEKLVQVGSTITPIISLQYSERFPRAVPVLFSLAYSLSLNANFLPEAPRLMHDCSLSSVSSSKRLPITGPKLGPLRELGLSNEVGIPGEVSPPNKLELTY